MELLKRTTLSTRFGRVLEQVDVLPILDWSLQLCAEQRSAVLADAGDDGKQLARDVDGAVACGDRGRQT